MAKKNDKDKAKATDGMPKVKKVKVTKSKKVIPEFTFDDMNKDLDKISLYGSKMSENTFSEVDHYISFGSHIINAACTGSIYGGIPNNRCVALAGPSGTGKTYLLLNAVKNAIAMGYYVVFYDSENAIDKKLMETFGIDTTKVRYEPMATLQEFRHHITSLIDQLVQKKREGIKIPKLFFALDSAGNLPSKKEVDDAISGSEKADMTRAKLTKSLFRIITVPLAEIKAPFVFTNHTYQTQSFISLTKAGGGTGPEYAASIILFLGKAQLTEGSGKNKIKSGIIVRVAPNKNRFAKPNVVKAFIRYDSGMNPYVGLEEYFDWDTVGVSKGEMDANGDINIKQNCKSWVCKHLDEPIKKANELYSDKVFTKDVLDAINERIQPMFNYGINDTIPDDMLGEEDEIIDLLDDVETEGEDAMDSIQEELKK